MLGPVIDVFRMRQYFDALTRTRDFARGIRDDVGLLGDLRRAVLPLPTDRRPRGEVHPFDPMRSRAITALEGKRLAVVATGGSGALASVVGVGRALEECGVRPEVISLCSGSALFGFPLAAGIPAEQVAAFCGSLRVTDYVDPDWWRLLTLVPTRARGFAGIIRGERLEATYRSLLGDMTLGDMPIAAYAPVWNVEHNRVEYLGPKTYPDLPVARAVHMAVALPLFIEPVRLGDGHWCDGGIVDIFPVHPVLDIEDPCDVVVAVNGFYPPEFEGEDQTGWEQRSFSILDAASQVRTCQQVQLARENLARLRAASQVVMLEPVPYETVQGIGFYRQFLDTREWGGFMRAGHRDALAALARLDRRHDEVALRFPA